jgi:hypothetical protein
MEQIVTTTIDYQNLVETLRIFLFFSAGLVVYGSYRIFRALSGRAD